MFFYILPFLTHCVVLINTDDKGLSYKKRVFQLSYGKTELMVKVRCFLEDDERSIPKLEIQNIDVQDSKLKLWFHNPQDQLSVDIQCNFGQLEDEIQLSECRAFVQTKPELKSFEYSINHKFKLSTNTKYSFSSRNIFVKVDESGKDMLKFSLDDLIIEFKDHKRSCDLLAESPIMFLEYDWPKVVHPCKVDHSKDFFDPSPHLNILVTYIL
ncbi:hypothetical protein RF11_14398 [Thelohanellus kitauei]|uniref:Uncharacterized protein n=1 Tax=Thelohanellus kitauei TaxID=669202 RepID=A0A0C2MM84_THEKT|nr:hypothetical protein RF11_14398 [Thelohanellus kitauei]